MNAAAANRGEHGRMTRYKRPALAVVPAVAEVDHRLGIDAVLGDWRRWQDAQGLSLRTMKERDYTMRYFFEFTGADPLAVTPDQLMQFVGRPGIGASTRVSNHRHTKAFHLWLFRTGRRDDNPVDRTPTPKQPRGVPRPLTMHELERLFASVNRRRTRMMILLGAFQGLRIHEIAKIRGEDIDQYAQTLYVVGKGRKAAVLPLHGTVAEYAKHFPSYGPWFPAYTGSSETITAKGVGLAIRRTMKRAGITKTPHSLRHFFATTLVQNGTDLRTVQTLMRHDSLETTQVYVQVSDTQRRAAMDAFTLPPEMSALVQNGGAR